MSWIQLDIQPFFHLSVLELSNGQLQDFTGNQHFYSYYYPALLAMLRCSNAA
jgi:hypothetical protein